MLDKWIGLTAYNSRKNTSCCYAQKGADLSTNAKLNAHELLEILTEHYLDVSDSTIDIFKRQWMNSFLFVVLKKFDKNHFN